MKLTKRQLKPIIFFQFYTTLIFLLVVLSFVGCHRSSVQKELSKNLEICLQAVNEHKLLVLKELIASDYNDFMGNNRQEILNVLSNYFQNYPQFKAKILGRKVNLNQLKSSATINCDVFLIASINDFSSSFFEPIRNLLRVELSYRKQNNKWLINSANWREIGMEEILPETIPFLPKTIFDNKFNN